MCVKNIELKLISGKLINDINIAHVQSFQLILLH